MPIGIKVCQDCIMPCLLEGLVQTSILILSCSTCHLLHELKQTKRSSEWIPSFSVVTSLRNVPRVWKKHIWKAASGNFSRIISPSVISLSGSINVPDKDVHQCTDGVLIHVAPTIQRATTTLSPLPSTTINTYSGILISLSLYVASSSSS